MHDEGMDLRRRALLGALALASIAPAACATSGAVDPAIVKAFAPTGRLRASINTGNPILASKDASGQAVGVSVDLANALGKQLGVPVELIVVDAAGKSVDIVANESADIGFFAIDPKRGQQIAQTSPYILIEGAYLVRDGSPITSNDMVDQPGRRIAVGKGSAYDLFLTRDIKQAELVRTPTSPEVVDTFLRDKLDVAAGVRQQVEADAKRVGGVHVLPGRFMVIEQAMGVPKSRGDAAATYLDAFVEKMKASGFVAAALTRHHIEGAAVAPPGRSS
jgi:polar amino acid transport system substrate-binding protein